MILSQSPGLLHVVPATLHRIHGKRLDLLYIARQCDGRSVGWYRITVWTGHIVSSPYAAIDVAVRGKKLDLPTWLAISSVAITDILISALSVDKF